MHNSKLDKTYSMSTNQFTGLDHAIVAKTLNASIGKAPYQCPAEAEEFESIFPVQETSWDWRA